MDLSNRERDQKLICFLKKSKLSPPKLESSTLTKQSQSLTPVTLHQNKSLKAQIQNQGSLSSKNHLLFMPGTKKVKNSSDSHKYKSLDWHLQQKEQEERKKNKIAIVLQEDEEGELQHYGRRQVVTSMDNKVKEEPLRVTQGRLYQIHFRNTKIKAKQKTKGSVLNYIKIANSADNDPNQTSSSFSTYYEFQTYMKSLLKQPKPEKTVSPSENTDKKYSVMPALKPSAYKQKRDVNKADKPSPNLRTLQQYIVSKRTGKQKEKQLIIESTKHQLVENLVLIKSKIEKQKFKRLNQGKEMNVENLVDKVLEEEEQNSKKVESPSRLSQIKKKIKSIPYFLNNTLDKSVYEQKIASYRELIFMVNLAHRIYDPIIILDQISLTKMQKHAIAKYSYYVGPGNNSMLIRSLMKRRIWWFQTKNIQDAHFVWTQLKVQGIFQKQPMFEKKEKEEETREFKFDESSEEQQDSSGQIDRKKKKKKRHLLQGYLTIQQCNPLASESFEKKQFPKGLMFRAPFSVKDEQKILTKEDADLYANMMAKIPLSQIQEFDNRLKYLPKTLSRKETSSQIRCHNHLQGSHSLGNKKALLHHLLLYYRLIGQPQDKAFPLSFHVRQGQGDPNYKLFLEHYRKIGREQPDLKNIWIMKPGENSNRGNGIVVVKDLRDIKRRLNVKEKQFNGQNRTFILQKYIEKPLLYWDRKFDIRQYMIITSLHGRLRAYFYGQGYVRTSSYLFNLNDIKDPSIHLTNDAVQKQCEDYGCFEAGNKVSFNDLQKYFTKYFPGRAFNINQIYAKMRELAKDSVLSTCISLDPQKRLHNFQIFGLDFMIDEDLRVYLIEVNTNPCLELSSNLLTRIIPVVVEQTFRIGLDPLFPPPYHYTNNTRYQAPDCNLEKLQLQLIFDEEREGEIIKQIYTENRDQYDEMLKSLSMEEFQTDEVYEDEGQEIEVDSII